MVAKKKFVVIAYDIANDKTRNRVSKLIERYGIRINLSVFECMLTDRQLEKVRVFVNENINLKTDTVVFYVICVNCFTKMIKIPNKSIGINTIHIVLVLKVLRK